MAAPNAPNPVNPNDQNQDQNQDQDQDQVPVGQVPVHVPVQPVLQPAPAQPAPAGVVPIPQFIYQNWIGKYQNFQVSQKRMQNPTFLVQEIGWKCITSQKERR